MEATRLSTSIDTSNLLTNRGGWDTLRKAFDACMHPVENPSSVESRLDQLVGNLDDYDQGRILAMDAPQEEIDRLTAGLESGFSFLVKYYQALKASDLGFTFQLKVGHHSHNLFLDDQEQEGVKSLPIDSFQLADGISNACVTPRTMKMMVSPLDVEGRVIGQSQTRGGFDSFTRSVDLKTNNPDVFLDEVSVAITTVFGEIFKEFVRLKNILVATQTQFDYEEGLKSAARSNQRSLGELTAQLGADLLDSIQ